MQADTQQTKVVALGLTGSLSSVLLPLLNTIILLMDVYSCLIKISGSDIWRETLLILSIILRPIYAHSITL